MRLYVRAIMYIFYISRAAVYRILRVMRGLVSRLQRLLLEILFTTIEKNGDIIVEE